MKKALQNSIERMVKTMGIAYTMDRIIDVHEKFDCLKPEDMKEDMAIAISFAIHNEPLYAAACEYRVFKGLGMI